MTPPDEETTASVRHERAGDLFLDALERPPAERLGFLLEACANDTLLLDEAVALLKAHATLDGFLATPILEAARGSPETGPAVLECDECGLCFEVQEGSRPPAVCPNDGSSLSKSLAGSAIIDSKYRLECRLGRGGMGAVYRARHLGLDKLFAVKLILAVHRDNELWLKLFSREAKALGRLKHPNIVDVTDYGVDARRIPYLVTELLVGQTLEKFCHADGALRQIPVHQALPLLEAVAQAIDFVHQNGVLHRDIKLSNIFLADVPKLMDFGLAAVAEVGAEGLVGTPNYMAPELFSGGISTVASDIYAFGVVAYAMLLGRMPDRSESKAVTGPEKAGLPAEMAIPLDRMLAEHPAQRPRSAVEAVNQLRVAWLTARRRMWRAAEVPKRLRIAMLAALVLAIFALGISGLGATRQLELKSVDARFALRPTRPPDPRILLVLLDEPTLEADSTAIADRADEFGEVLEALYRAGAPSVALDFELPRTWSHSQTFSKSVLRHAGQLTLGLYSSPTGETLGAESIAGLTAAALGPERLSSLFAFVNLDQDADGEVHQGRISYSDRGGARRPAWAAGAVAKIAPHGPSPERFWIDYSVDSDRFQRISWKDVPERAAHSPEVFRNRLVLVGGDYLGSGDDAHRTPTRDEPLSGVALQALIANAILSGFPLRDATTWAWVLAAGLLGGVVTAMVLILPAWLKVAYGVVAALLLFPLAAVLAFRWVGLVVPIVAPMMALVIGALGAVLLRRGLPRFPAE